MSFFGVKRNELLFCDRLLVLLETGRSLQRALELLMEASQPAYVRQKSGNLKHKLLNGNSFQDSVIDVLGISSLAALKGITVSIQPFLFLTQVRAFISTRTLYVKTLINVSAYPLFLLVTCVVVLVLVWCVFLPHIMSFSSGGVGGLRYVEMIYDFFQVLSWVDILVIAGCFGGVLISLFNALFLYVRARLSVDLGVLFWMLGVCCSQGVSLNTALSVLESHPHLGSKCRDLKGALLNGEQLNDYFVRHGLSGCKEGGNLGELFIEVGRFVFERSQNQLKIWMALLSPLLLVVVGFVVFLLVYLLFVPLLTSLKSI